MAINVTISTGGQTTAVTIPEVKNTVQVTGGNITQAERDKLAGIEAGATTDQVLTGGDNINVSESGGDYTINLDNTIDISGDATLTNAFVDKVLIRDTSSNSLPGNVAAAHFYVDTTGNTQLKAKSNTDLRLSSNQDVHIVPGNSSEATIGDTQGLRKITVNSSGLTFKASTHQFTFRTDGRLGIGTSSTYYMPINSSGASLGEGLKLGVGGQLEFGSVGADLSTSNLNDLSGVDVDYNDWNGDTQGPNMLYNALVYDGTNWVMWNSVQGSFPPNTTNTSFLGDAAPIDKSKIGFDSFNNGLSINSDTSYASSGINLYVDGGARVDGAIQVNDPSSTGYAFPTADGTANQVLATNGSGAVTFVTPSTSNVTEGTNLYYTDARVAANPAVAANTAKISYPTADSTKVGFISVTQAVDLDTMESDIATNNAKVGYTDSAVDARIAAANVTDLSDVTSAGSGAIITSAERTKLTGIATGATANDTDANLKNRANHTGTQTASTISDFNTQADARIAAASIDDLSDVDTSTAAPTDGQALVWDNANSKWEPGTVSGGGGGGGIGTADQTLDADRTIDTNGYNLDIELDPTGTADTFTIHDGTHDLFQVDTSTTGTIFSVNDVSGLPKLTVDDSDGVTIDKFKEVKYEKPSNTDFSYQGDVVYFGATTGMTQGDLYYYNSSGNWAQADADAASSSGGVLLAIALGTASDTNGMLLKGTFTMAAGAIDGTEATGDELYVSTTAGHITSDVSAYTTGDVVRVVGYCLDGTNGQIWFNPSNDFITLA